MCTGKSLSAAAFILSIAASSSAFGSGFGIFTQGASALGQADAVVAHTDGPSAIFFNPALLTTLPGTQVEIGTTAVAPSRKFTSAQDGSVSGTEDTVFFPSTIYISHTFNDKVSAGIGVFNPFGLGSTWGNAWEGRYIATESEMTTFNINPVVAVRITPKIALAAGVDILLLDATFKNRLNLSGFGSSDGTQTLKGDGTGVGYNLGMLVDITDDISLGASYRSQIDVDVKGDLRTDIPESPASGILSAAFPHSNARTKIKLPQQVFAGLNYKGFGPLSVEAGIRWEGWSSYDQLKIDLDQPVGGATSSTRAKNWKDTFAYNLGATYRINDVVTILGGYLYGQNPVPSDTFEPAIPDSPTHLFCVGTDLNFGRMKVALGYGYQLQEGRSKNNSVSDPVVPGTGSANGKYESTIHLAALSLTYRF